MTFLKKYILNDIVLTVIIIIAGLAVHSLYFNEILDAESLYNYRCNYLNGTWKSGSSQLIFSSDYKISYKGTFYKCGFDLDMSKEGAPKPDDIIFVEGYYKLKKIDVADRKSAPFDVFVFWQVDNSLKPFIREDSRVEQNGRCLTICCYPKYDYIEYDYWDQYSK